MYAAEWPCCHDPLRFSLGSDDLLRTRNNPPSDATGASQDILSPAPPPLCDAQSQSSSFPVSTSTHRNAPLPLVGRGQPSIIVFSPLAFLYCAPRLWPLARHPFTPRVLRASCFLASKAEPLVASSPPWHLACAPLAASPLAFLRSRPLGPLLRPLAPRSARWPLGPLAPWPLGLVGPLASSPPWPVARPLGPLAPLRGPLGPSSPFYPSFCPSWPSPRLATPGRTLGLPPSLDVLTALSLPCPLAH